MEGSWVQERLSPWRWGAPPSQYVHVLTSASVRKLSKPPTFGIFMKPPHKGMIDIHSISSPSSFPGGWAWG